MLFLRHIAILLLVLGLGSSAALAASGHGFRHGGSGWIDSLTDEQRQQVDRIVAETQPRLLELRVQMREKMKELQAFAYREDDDNEALSRLGHDLQALRDALRKELQALDERLVREVGVPALPYRGRSCSVLGTRTPPTEGGEVRPQ